MSGKRTKEDLIKPLMGSEVRAKDIVQALAQEENGPVRIILRHKKILGNLDLKHRLITIPVTFKNCEFLGEVDLRNCEFEQAVNVTGCTFRRGFNSGGSGGTHTIYRKDLICYEATFEADVSFVGSHFKSRASFANATFQSSEKTVNFNDSSFDQYLNCNGATFKGPAYFAGIKCGRSGLFLPAEPEGGEGESSRPVSFEKEANFRLATFGDSLVCQKANFKDRADFSYLKCGDHAVFTLANFEGEGKDVYFHQASIGGSFFCDGAIFKGPAYFAGIKCGRSGLFLPAEINGEEGESSRPTSFEKGADLRFASFGETLECNGAVFKGVAYFVAVKCGSNAIFNSAEFGGQEEEKEGEAFTSFARASIGGDFFCNGATFKGPAYFAGIKCEGSGFFTPVEPEGEEGKGSRPVSFEKAAEFRFASFAINLECNGATFKEETNFGAIKCGDNLLLTSANFEPEEQFVYFNRANIGGTLECIDTTFNGPVTFYNATLGILALGDNRLFAPETLNLRELTFKRFDGTPEQATQFVEAQNPAWFSRDPYIQLEQYYSGVGKDAQAKDIYYKGHQASRVNARKVNGSVEWSRGTNVLDWFWKVLTRYGISTWRLLAIAIAFVIAGTLMFYLPDLYLSHDALKLASASANSAPWEEGWLYRAAYSLDLFLPLVNLHIDEKWTPNGPVLQAYAVLHTMIGWLVVPLLIAALAGIIRR